MNTNVHDVAAYIISKTGPLAPMKLQRLLYYSQSFSLFWNDWPLFTEEFQAWSTGPVCYEIFEKCRHTFQVDSWDWGNKDNLTSTEIKTVNRVISEFGSLSGTELSTMIMKQDPWIESRKGIPKNEQSHNIISKRSMLRYLLD